MLSQRKLIKSQMKYLLRTNSLIKKKKKEMDASTPTGEKTEPASNKEPLNLPGDTMQVGNLDVLGAEMWNVSTVDEVEEDDVYEVTPDMRIFGWYYTPADLCFKTPLHVHVRAGNLTLARLLLQKGADVDATDAFGNTPLHEAIDGEEYEIACMLLYYGASVNTPNALYGKTPFMYALECNVSEFTDLLFDYADFKAVDRFGMSILSLAELKSNSLIPKILAQYEDVNSVEDICECLKHSLCYVKIPKESLYLYKYVIPRINQVKLVQEYGTILNEVMHANFESAEDFMECFYLVLSLDCAVKLVQECSFKCLFQSFRRYEMGKSDRMSCLYSLLALNKHITYEEFDYIYTHFGFNEELEAIFQTRPNIQEMLATLQASSVNMAFIIFYSYCGPIDVSFLIQRNLQRILNDYIKFFTISNDTKEKYFCDEIVKLEFEFVRKLNDRDVPSLREICRNSIRKTIISNKTKNYCMYEVYDAVKALPVPKLIQHVLLLKRPLYM